jgi:hypothetical protein
MKLDRGPLGCLVDNVLIAMTRVVGKGNIFLGMCGKSGGFVSPLKGAISHSIGRVHAQKMKPLRKNALGEL